MKNMFCTAALGIGLALSATLAMAQEKPAELKIAMTTFLTGSASVFGIPAKAAAEILVDDINAAGGIAGVKIKPIFIDEGVGIDKLLSEYRRVVQEEGVKVAFAAISSGNCNALAPVAEDLKILNVMWDCASEKILESRRYKYVVRTVGNGTSEVVATVMHLLRTKPNFNTLAIVNQDYAWGHDSRVLFMNTLLAMKPDVKLVVEISRLQALAPDVILSTSWGGDLDTLVRQASQRGLTRSSTWVLPLAESSLERLGKALPDGAIIGMRGDHYFLHPEYKDDPKHKAFVEKFRAKTGQYPIYPVYHAAAAFQAIVDGYAAAIKANGGKWPSTELLADTMHTLKFRGLTRPVTMREDGQGMASQMLGVAKMTAAYPFPIIEGLTLYPPEVIQNPVGTLGPDWAKTLKADLLKDPRIKAY
jgi:branched-chain amino acid transport system substrate-binding protein